MLDTDKCSWVEIAGNVSRAICAFRMVPACSKSDQTIFNRSVVSFSFAGLFSPNPSQQSGIAWMLVFVTARPRRLSAPRQ